MLEICFVSLTECLYQTVKCVHAISSSQGVVKSDNFQSDHLHKCANERTKEGNVIAEMFLGNMSVVGKCSTFVVL